MDLQPKLDPASVASPRIRVAVNNRQKTKRLRGLLVRQFCRAAVEEGLRTDPAKTKTLPAPVRFSSAQVAVHFVGASEMTLLNETFLGHPGATDVITFDYRKDAPAGCLSGEVFVCVDVAMAQAPEFRTTWQEELARYVIHGVLHLLGYDDKSPAPRKRMKLEEERFLKELSRRFDWGKLEAVKNGATAK
jgi:probable rRNA maturation factor